MKIFPAVNSPQEKRNIIQHNLELILRKLFCSHFYYLIIVDAYETNLTSPINMFLTSILTLQILNLGKVLVNLNLLK
jgi:hypothetical protein